MSELERWRVVCGASGVAVVMVAFATAALVAVRLAQLHALFLWLGLVLGLFLWLLLAVPGFILVWYAWAGQDPRAAGRARAGDVHAGPERRAR